MLEINGQNERHSTIPDHRMLEVNGQNERHSTIPDHRMLEVNGLLARKVEDVCKIQLLLQNKKP